MKNKNKIRLYFSICILAYIIIKLLQVTMSARQANSVNGILTSFEFVVCIIILKIDNEKGIKLVNLLMLISTLNIFAAILRFRTIGALPGFFNILIYIFSLNFISSQFKRRSKEAVTDYITGLNNNRGLFQLIEKKIEDDKPFSVVYIDLGNFKFINDNFGHEYGDKILKKTADTINDVVGDSGILSRVGGDEFVLILYEDCDVKAMTEKVLDCITGKISVQINGVMIDSYLTAYAGIAKYPEDAVAAETLIKYSDIAMYRATNTKTERYCFFDKEMENKLNRQMEVENYIKDALDKDLFFMVYQPQYYLEGKLLRGFETLLRMKTEDGKLISPGEFIPVAERGELIVNIDDYVLKHAMLQFKDVVLNVNKELTISVNVSAKNIGSFNFADKVKGFLEETGFPAKNFEIEITEYCVVQSVDAAIQNINKLRDLGVLVALDDFGTGYSSLSYLSKMPINLLKIDKSLIDDIENSEKSRDFVETVISMGHLMGCEVISEGVESEDQISVLAERKCDFIQGYVWGKPLDYQVALELAGS